jgi:hypothetical protein
MEFGFRLVDLILTKVDIEAEAGNPDVKVSLEGTILGQDSPQEVVGSFNTLAFNLRVPIFFAFLVLFMVISFGFTETLDRLMKEQMSKFMRTLSVMLCGVSLLLMVGIICYLIYVYSFHTASPFGF